MSLSFCYLPWLLIEMPRVVYSSVKQLFIVAGAWWYKHLILFSRHLKKIIIFSVFPFPFPFPFHLSHQGLDNCRKLEDLSLNNNCISRLEGLDKLTHLSRLSLAHNQLTTIDTGVLANLPQLLYLALDNNRLAYLSGLQHVQSLIELYIGNNMISNIRDIFYLKVISYVCFFKN